MVARRIGGWRWGLTVAAVLASGSAWSQPRRPAPAAVPAASADLEGTVLAIQGEELVLDLGSTRGAIEGAAVEIWRPIKLKHPVSGKVLTDRFRIGSLELGQVRKTMALAKATGALSRPAEIGDVVVLVVKAEAPPAAGARVDAPPTEGGAPPEARAQTPEEQEAQVVGAMFDSLKGADLVTRIRRYEEHAAAKPQGRFARVLYEEAAALRQLIASKKRGPEEPSPELRTFQRPVETVAGVSIRIAVEMSDATMGAVLHIRKRGTTVFTSLPMASVGSGYFAASIPADRVVAPRVEYFIEGTTGSGKGVAVLGSAESPEGFDVYDAPRPEPPRKVGGTVQISTDYADYNRLRNNDRVWQTEGFFGIRLGDTGIRAVRTGFGVYRGVGGSVDDLDKKGLAPRSVGLTYGYLEAEIGFVKVFSLITRVAVGLEDAGITGGGQVMVRIGSDLRTNLLLGGELLGGVGLRGITQLELNVFERFPIVLRTEVSNQPAGSFASGAARNDAKTSQETGDIGGRGIAQLGFRITPDLLIAARGSFQGRTIRHAGPGVGGAVGYSW